MNSFGSQFRVMIFGESHGPEVGIIIDGCPPGIPLAVHDFAEDMDRRRGGDQKGTTGRKEKDQPRFLSGVFNDVTTGAPICIAFENGDTQSAAYEKMRDQPRPGHADFVAAKKFHGFEDYRGGGHFSGRLTVCLVAAGVIAKKVLTNRFTNPHLKCTASIIEVGGEKDIEKGLQKAIDAKDSVGGIVECIVENLPVGLGEPFFDSVESLLSHAVFSIPAIKAIEFGAGFQAAKMYGSGHNDSLKNESGETFTNHAGGVVGGLTNGNALIFRVAVKPTSSTPALQESLNVRTKTIEQFSVKGRHDLCIALRVPPVLEAVSSCVLADLLLRSDL